MRKEVMLERRKVPIAVGPIKPADLITSFYLKIIQVVSLNSVIVQLLYIT